jgi:hypothetical protein
LLLLDTLIYWVLQLSQGTHRCRQPHEMHELFSTSLAHSCRFIQARIDHWWGRRILPNMFTEKADLMVLTYLSLRAVLIAKTQSSLLSKPVGLLKVSG